MKDNILITAKITKAETEDVLELARSKGLVAPHPALGFLKATLMTTEKANGNGVRLSTEATKKALPSLLFSQLNPQHEREIVYGSCFHAEMNQDGIVEVAFVFYKDIFPAEYEKAKELLEKGELSVSWEITADLDNQEKLSDGTRIINDFQFLGVAILYGIEPAYPEAKIKEIAKLKIPSKDPELLFAKKLTQKSQEELDFPDIFLVTTSDDKHFHVAEIDENGNGQTISGHGEGKHEEPHQIVNWQIQTAESTISEEPHAHRILDTVMAAVKEKINARKYPNPKDPRHKKDGKLEDKKSKKDKNQGGETKMKDEQKQKVAELRERFGDLAKDLKDEDLLDETKVAELENAKEEKESEKQKTDLEKVNERIAELENENKELKATIEAHKSEVEQVKENAEKIGKLKVELEDNPYTKDFKDEDYLSEDKVNQAKKKKEMDDKETELKAKEEEIKQKEKDLSEKMEKAKLNVDDDTGNQDTETKNSLIKSAREKAKKLRAKRLGLK